MLKTINGIEYMAGTSEGALYLATFWSKSGMVIGIKTEKVNVTKKTAGMACWIRAQTFNEDGSDAVPTMSQVNGLKLFHLTVKSDTHLSGQGPVFVIPDGSDPVAVADDLCDAFESFVEQVAKQGHYTKPKKEYVRQYMRERYYDAVGYNPEQDYKTVVEKLDDVELDESFDVMSMLGKGPKDI